jgi:hypothetical protein
MDEWHAVGQHLIMAEARGELTTGELLRPHNEHRVVWTRTILLGLLRANGQWDARLGMVVNTFIHAAAIAILLALLERHTGASGAWFGALAAAA